MAEPAIPAATLILVREQPGSAPELLMVQRASGMAFAGGALVFPGGRVDDADRTLAAALGLTDSGAAIAAVRETIEETAVPAGLEPLPSRDQALQLQQSLLQGRNFGELLADAGFCLNADPLTPLARWVPKFHAARRFDTLFFLAPSPPGKWEPAIVPGECTAAQWLTAEQALELDRSGEAKLIFPTRRNLERLAQHSTFAAMVADAAAHPVRPITPWVEEHEGERFITIADDLGYPVTRERLEGLWRG